MKCQRWSAGRAEFGTKYSKSQSSEAKKTTEDGRALNKK